MSYQKTNWVNGYTPLNASNMNKIEEGIFNNDTFLSSLDIRVEDLEGKIGQGGINSVNVSGNGNAITNASYDTSTKILNFEKNTTFALDSDLDSVNDKNLYHLGAFDSISGNVITRQTGYIKLNGSESGWNSYNAGFWAYITINDITPTSSQTELGQFVVSRGNVVTLRTMINTSSGIQISLDNTSLNIRPNVSDVNTIDTFKTWLSQNPIVIQYKLTSSYTEQINENQPLTTLDQSGSQWLRSEWEKGLNLCSSFANESYKFIIYGNLKPNTTYHFTTNDTTNSQTPIVKIYSLNGTLLQTYRDGIYGVYLTNDGFTTDGNVNGNVRVEIGINKANSDVTRCMLVEGSHAYPYQVYRGGIVRESQLNDRLNFKIFDASNSTMNDVLDYIQQNYENIISIIYYAKSGGEAFGRSIIYNADEGILAYITSDLTFANVQLNTDAEEGSDYIIIYKQH